MGNERIDPAKEVAILIMKLSLLEDENRKEIDIISTYLLKKENYINYIMNILNNKMQRFLDNRLRRRNDKIINNSLETESEQTDDLLAPSFPRLNNIKNEEDRLLYLSQCILNTLINIIKIRDNSIYRLQMDEFIGDFARFYDDFFQTIGNGYGSFEKKISMKCIDCIENIRKIVQLIRDHADIFFEERNNSDYFILKNTKQTKNGYDSLDVLNNNVVQKISSIPILLPMVYLVPISGIYIVLLLYNKKISFADSFYGIREDDDKDTVILAKKRKMRYKDTQAIFKNLERYFQIKIQNDLGQKKSDTWIDVCGMYRFCNLSYPIKDKLFTFLRFDYLLIHDGISPSLTGQQQRFLTFQTILLSKLEEKAYLQMYKFECYLESYVLLFEAYEKCLNWYYIIFRCIAERDIEYLTSSSQQYKEDVYQPVRNIENTCQLVEKECRKLLHANKWYWYKLVKEKKVNIAEEIVIDNPYYIILMKSRVILNASFFQIKYKYWKNNSKESQDKWSIVKYLMISRSIGSNYIRWQNLNPKYKERLVNLFYDKSEDELEKAFKYSKLILNAFKQSPVNIRKEPRDIQWNQLTVMMFLILYLGEELVRDFKQNKDVPLMQILRNIKNHGTMDFWIRLTIVENYVRELFLIKPEIINDKMQTLEPLIQQYFLKAQSENEVLQCLERLWDVLCNDPIFQYPLEPVKKSL